MQEQEPSRPQYCDNCKQYHDHWLLFFAQLGISVCEECLEQAILTRNSLRWGLKNEA